MKKIALISLFLIAILTSWVHVSMAAVHNTLFEIESVDTMKYSRDAARNKEVESYIPEMVAAAAHIYPTHIAIATPYDDDFIPIIKLWVTEIHKRNINVWYRGNFSAWENWFGYERFKDPYDHIAKTERFIKNNPGLFEDGDIFTPVPEAENGGFGDPRKDEATKRKFFDFLPKSYDSCVASMKSIGKDVKCGYFSVNGDVAHMFTKDIVDRTGGVLVIDHYVKTPKELIKDIKEYNRKTGAKIILGEYGAPIPDIHGELTDTEQAELIKENLVELARIRNIVGGINYWTAFGGSTEIFRERTNPKLAAATLASYFNPMQIGGTVQDEFGNAVAGATITNGLTRDTTNLLGNYSLMATPEFLEMKVIKKGFNDAKYTIIPKVGEQNYTQNVELTVETRNFWYYMRRITHSLTTFTFY